MKPTQLLPVLVGLSLCSASAALLYVWYTTKDDKKDEVDGPASCGLLTKLKTKEKQKVTKVECTIPNDLVPLIIGRAGANVKAIADKTNTKIEFREKDALNQICEISGVYENVMKAANLVKEEASNLKNVKEEIFVPASAYNKIIGRQGQSLREICRKSLTQVNIDVNVDIDRSLRRVTIIGARTNVKMARRLIEDKVREHAEEQEAEGKREPRSSPRGTASASSESINKDFTSPSSHIEVNKERLLSGGSLEGQLEVYVSATASPARFWIQLVGPQSSKLDELVEEMTAYYNLASNQELHRIADPHLGQIVTAMFKYDSKWYRAEIVGILPNEYDPRNVVLDLYFLDYGDSEYVQHNEVFELRTDFLQLRFQAIECFLAHCQPADTTLDGQWKSDAVSRFEELTHVARWKKLIAKVVTTKERNKDQVQDKQETSPIPGVELYDIIEGHEVNIASQLIVEGYAYPDNNIDTPESAINSDNILRLDGGHSASPVLTSNDITPETNPHAETSPTRNLLNIINNDKANRNDQQLQQTSKSPKKSPIQKYVEHVASKNNHNRKSQNSNSTPHQQQSNGHVANKQFSRGGSKQSLSKQFIDNEQQIPKNNKSNDFSSNNVLNDFDSLAKQSWNDIVEAEQNSLK